MLVESGASAHFIDGDLLPDAHRLVRDVWELDSRMVITSASLHELYETATGVLPVRVVDTGGIVRDIKMSVTLVPVLGRHLLSLGAAHACGVNTLYPDHNYIDRDVFRISLHPNDDLHFVDFALAGRVESTGNAAVAACSADVWCHRLGHPHAAVEGVVAKVPQPGVVLQDSMSKCDVCLNNKSKQHTLHTLSTKRPCRWCMSTLTLSDLLLRLPPASTNISVNSLM